MVARDTEKTNSLIQEITETAESGAKGVLKFLKDLTKSAKRDYLVAVTALLTACAGRSQAINKNTLPRGIVTEDTVSVFSVEEVDDNESNLLNEERRTLHAAQGRVTEGEGFRIEHRRDLTPQEASELLASFGEWSSTLNEDEK